MVYGTQITIVTGAFVNQLITGGPHIVWVIVILFMIPNPPSRSRADLVAGRGSKLWDFDLHRLEGPGDDGPF